MESRAEQIAKTFTLWEKNLRGWKVWSDPVSLEAPYIPFLEPESAKRYSEDDGRIPGLASRISKLFKSTSTDPISSTLVEESDTNIPPDYLLDYQPDIIEMKITLSGESIYSKETFERFLLSTSNCIFPITYEFQAISESIQIFICTCSVDIELVRTQLKVYFPGVLIDETEQALETVWRDHSHQESLIVDLGLNDEVHRPINTFDRLDIDPLSALFGVMDNVKDDELIVFQIRFKQTINPWSESLLRSIFTSSGEALFENSDLPSITQRKISKLLYAVSVRFAVWSESQSEVENIATQVMSSLGVYSGPGTNSFIPLHNEEIDPVEHISDLLLRSGHRCGMLLNTDELISLFHFPSESIRTEKLKREIQKTQVAPEISGTSSLHLGFNHHQGKQSKVLLDADQRSRHTYVIGASGTGKSTLLKNNIIQDIQNGEGVGVLDPHGDLIDQIIPHIPEDRLQDVILLDPSDSEFPIAFNILSAATEEERILLASDLTDLFRRFASTWGDQMTAVLDNAILAFLYNPVPGTLMDLKRFLAEPGFRKEYVKTVTDTQVSYYWNHEFSLLKGTPQASVLSRLSTFLRPKPIRYMLSQKENKLDLADIMDNRKILLAKLSSGLIGEENSHLLGALLVSKINQITMSRQHIAESDRQYFWLYIDEFQNFITRSMENILSGARKYRLGLTIAHQELKQVESRDSRVASSVISNPYTRICFRLGDSDARKLSDGFSHFDSKDLQSLGTGEALCRFGQSDHDFNLTTLPPPESSKDDFEQKYSIIQTETRERYATPKSVIEEQLSEIYKIPDPPQTVKLEKNTSQIKEEKVAEVVKEEVQEDPSSEVIESDIQYTVDPIPISESEPEPLNEPVEEEETLDQSSQGIGGNLHKSTQLEVQQFAAGFNYSTEIEKEILDGKGKVDVSLEKEGVRIAVEISHTTPVAKEVGNILKCIKAGYDHVVMICEDSGKLIRIQERALKKISNHDLPRVQFHTSPGQMTPLFNKIEAQLGSYTKINPQGHNLSVELVTPSPELIQQKASRMKKLMAEINQRISHEGG